MDLQTLLNERNLSKYQLSKLSGVPKTTIMDICAGRSDMERCNAKTVQKLAQALNCTMEDMMKLSSPYDGKGLPKDRSYWPSQKDFNSYISALERNSEASQTATPHSLPSSSSTAGWRARTFFPTDGIPVKYAMRPCSFGTGTLSSAA